VSIVYLGQQNGTMVQVPAGNVQNNGSNQIIVTTNGLLAPGDYRVELWYNTFGGGAPTTNGSAFLTVAGAPAGGGGGPLAFMARSTDRVDHGKTRYFVPSGASGVHDEDDIDESEMRIPVACTATGLSAWAVNTDGHYHDSTPPYSHNDDFPLEAGDSIKVSLLINGSDSTINCTIDQNSGGKSCGPSTAEVNLAANDQVVIKVENSANHEDAEIVANWTCAPTPPPPS
ncbi:MAG: hypothetical protein KDJ70_02445, partial [Candidatus Competibacteraceae bacterium]|nr:hypothetical protein [Candidatus Competibacteraceae bacterium]